MLTKSDVFRALRKNVDIYSLFPWICIRLGAINVSCPNISTTRHLFKEQRLSVALTTFFQCSSNQIDFQLTLLKCYYRYSEFSVQSFEFFLVLYLGRFPVFRCSKKSFRMLSFHAHDIPHHMNLIRDFQNLEAHIASSSNLVSR